MTKWAVITGGSKGIGFATLERFARAGFDVLTCSRNEKELTQNTDYIKKKYSVACEGMVADLSLRKDIDRFAEWVLNKQRALDVLINNVGTYSPGTILEEEEGVLEKMLNTNLFSAYHVTRKLAPTMLRAKSGHIFNVCSIAGVKAYVNGGAYSVSKFALMGLTKNLREELKDKGVRVTAVIPGATKTSSWDGVDLPDRRLMLPEDIAEIIYSAYALSSSSVVEEIVIRPQLGDI